MTQLGPDIPDGRQSADSRVATVGRDGRSRSSHRSIPVVGSDRGVSTVVDVSLALLLIAVSIGVLGMHFAKTPAEHEPENAREVASMLGGTTARVEYSVGAVQDHQAFDDEGYSLDAADFRRVSHGSPLSMIAKTAVANAKLNGEVLTNGGPPFAEAIDSEIRDRYTGADATNAHVVALWRPYEGASIVGEVHAGPRPPGDADVSVHVVNVSSGMPTVSDGEVAFGFRDEGYQGAAEPIADAIVRGWFPVASTQVALEKDGAPYPLAAYRYQRFRNVLIETDVVDDFDYRQGGVPFSHISHSDADAAAANQRVRQALTKVIAQDLKEHYDNPTPDAVGNSVQTGIVQIVVKTWSR